MPSLATYIGSMPEQLGGAGDRRADRDVGLAHRHRDAGRARQLVQHGRHAAAGGVAHAAQAAPAASSSASAAGQSERVSELDLGVELELAAGEHDRGAVLADRAATRGRRSPGSQRRGRERRARSSTWPIPVVQMYIPSAWPRSTTLVSPVMISTPAAAAAAAIASTSARSDVGVSPSSRTSAER